MTSRSPNARGFTLIEMMVAVSIIGVLSVISLTRFDNARARAKQTEVRAGLKSIFVAERSFYAATDTYSADLGQVGANVERGNRYAYYLELPATLVQSRSAAATGSVAGADAVAADTFAHPEITTQPTEFSTDGAATFTFPTGSPTSTATAYVITGTRGSFVARAYGNIGSTNLGTFDAWFVSSNPATVTSPCQVSNNTNVPPGVAGNTYNQTSCN